MNELLPLDDSDPQKFALGEEEELLAYTQRIRIAAVGALTLGRGISTDPKELASLTSVLDGIDRQEINKAKIDLENQSVKNEQDTTAFIAAISQSMGNRNPYESQEPIERTVEHEGTIIEGVVLVAGELDSKPQQMNYDTFMKEYKKKNPKPTDSDEE